MPAKHPTHSLSCPCSCKYGTHRDPSPVRCLRSQSSRDASVHVENTPIQWLGH